MGRLDKPTVFNMLIFVMILVCIFLMFCGETWDGLFFLGVFLDSLISLQAATPSTETSKEVIIFCYPHLFVTALH
jgi:hypothetical protein